MKLPHVSRRKFLQSSAALAAFSGIGVIGAPRAQAEESRAEPFSFVHLTDVHVQPELQAGKGWRQCVEAVNALPSQPDFVITGGDLIMDGLATDADRIDLQWKVFDAAAKDFEMPVHHVIGNHDVGGWSPKSKLSKTDSRYGKELFAERYGQGRTYRSFDHKGWHFVLLDSIGQDPETRTGYIGLIDDAQLDWLRADLQKVGTQTPVVLVTHIPCHSIIHQRQSGPTTEIGPWSLITNAHKLYEVYKPYNVRLVLSGHGHIRERIELGGVTHIQSGAVCGRWWKGHLFDEPEAFATVSCSSDAFDYRYHDYGWDARPNA